jgi:hypothetical protein
MSEFAFDQCSRFCNSRRFEQECGSLNLSLVAGDRKSWEP